MARKPKDEAKKAKDDKKLDEELEETFPASDPPSMTEPPTHGDPPKKRPARRPK
jgi:hypothetical protein